MTVRRHALAERRKAAGYSQEALAEALRVEPSTVGRWERGETAPQPWFRPKLARVLNVSRVELETLLIATDTAAELDLVPGGELSELTHVERLRHRLTDTLSSSAVTGASLDDWEQTVLRHGQAARDRPPGLVLSDLGADLADLQPALVRCRTSSALRRLTCVTAQLAGLVCLTLIKLDERRTFRGWARTARLAADEASDPLTFAWVRAQEAYGHFYSGDHTEAIDVAQHAQSLADSTPCIGAVLAAALEARAQAALAREQETGAALARAETMLSRLDDASTGTSAFNYNEAQLRFHEGNALTQLHDTARAWPAQQRALELCPASDYMDRTLTLLDRADCLAHDHELDGALVYVTNALEPLSDRQRQGIITARARMTLAALPPAQRERPAVRDLHDLLTDAREAPSLWSL
jgi:transcriptional regulator with XRE-family HTH domain